MRATPPGSLLRDDLAFAVVPLGREKAEAILAEWDERESYRGFLEEIRSIAGDPLISDTLALRACLLAACDGLGFPWPQDSREALRG